MADSLAHYPDLKCTTLQCEHPKRAPRLAKKDNEKIEYSDGYKPTVVWNCDCGWKKMVLFKEA